MPITHPIGGKERKKGTHQPPAGNRCLSSCQSPWNTPLYLSGRWKQDSIDQYRTCERSIRGPRTFIQWSPTPIPCFTLWGPKRQYTVLDLKDAFFCIPMAKCSQSLFAFMWVNLDGGYSGHLIWTQLQQGLKNSPTIFEKPSMRTLGNSRRDTFV